MLLAGCSFAAYLDPRERLGASAGRPGVLETANGARVRFLDRSFFERIFSGRLKVRLEGAEDLAAADFWGTSDPYCVVSLGQSSARSTTKLLTLKPQWGEELELLVERDSGASEPRLRVRVFDEDIGQADDELGVAEARLGPEILDGRAHRLELPLHRAGVSGATVTVSLSFEPILTGTNGSRDEGGPGGDPPAGGEPLASTTGEDPFSEDWRSLFEGSEAGSNPVDAANFRPSAFVDNPDSSTQAWLFSNPAERQLIVAFRGTEQTDWKDIATDINLVPSSLEPERAPSDALLGFIPNLWRAGGDGILVHGGFLEAYDSVRRAVIFCVDALAGPGWTVSVTGHSLGGALATLCSYELAEMARERPDGSRSVDMINFGSPRVGNGAFVAEYNALVPEAVRVVNRNDIVPTVPRMLGYKHVGEPVVLRSREEEAAAPEAADGLREDAFGEEVAADIIPQLADLWLSSEDRDRSRIQELLQQELDLFATLRDGSALLEHLEDFYLVTLQRSAAARPAPRGPGRT